MKKLTKKDCNKFLKFGKLTQPFLKDEDVLIKVMIDYNHKVKTNESYTKIESLYYWIAKNMNKKASQEEKQHVKFQRTAKEVWESGFCSGCTDWAILFATFARQIGIPTTFLHTAQKQWVKNLQDGKNELIHKGHSFCECFYNGKWILVDPTFKKIEIEYDLNNLNLSYEIVDSGNFIPYFRGLDLGKKQTMKEHNKEMDEICFNLEV